jgi:hypothetical protein
VQEKVRLSRVAGCDNDEASFNVLMVFIVRVAITCQTPFS